MTDDIFTPIEESTTANQRKAVRYISSSRNKAIITLKQLLMPNKYIHVEVINISSKGARASSKYKFSEKATITLNFKISNGDTWKVPAKIVRLYSHSEFGIIFDTLQHDLIDEIMKHEADFTIT